MQIDQKTWYITSIAALDADHDRLSLSQVMPGQQMGPGMAGGALYADVTKPHSHTTGEQITVTLDTVV